MKALVGYTGFVGGNLAKQASFDLKFNSKNIGAAFGAKPDLLVYAGVRAEKYLANNNPEADMKLITEAEENIKKICPERLVLISTIDVFSKPCEVDETSEINEKELFGYGLNRYKLEEWVRKNYPNALIVRLPALFGEGLKKNFIYDLIERVPQMLKNSKFNELCTKLPMLKSCYEPFNNDFYKLSAIDTEQKKALRTAFEKIGFSALSFTDSRSVYQFYQLKKLWVHIKICLKNNIKLWHAATEPVSAAEIYEYIFEKAFFNELKTKAAYYNYRTLYCGLFGGENGYIYKKSKVLSEIKKFINEQSGRVYA